MTESVQNTSEDRTAPEWHLANILGYICSRPSDLRDLGDDDTLRGDYVIRVGDIRAATACITRCFGSDGNEEARWVADVENACPCCHGSGHKDDVQGVNAASLTQERVATHRMTEDGESTENWAINQPGFSGSIRQLTCCARCGKDLPANRRNEKVTFARDLTRPHALCEGCFDELPD